MTPQLALCTDASSGIGYHLAKQFAEHGYDLIVAAEDTGILTAAEELASEGTQVQALQVDLSTAEGVEELYGAVTDSGRPLAAAALNTGVGLGGRFVDTHLTDDLETVDLNVRSTMHLAKLVLRDMARRGAGRVLFTSSITATMPGSHRPVYDASKSFVQSLAEAIADELRDTGVVVTSLMPFKDDPADVARQGYRALMDGKRQVIAGSLHAKALGVANKVVPATVKTAVNRLLSAKGAS